MKLYLRLCVQYTYFNSSMSNYTKVSEKLSWSVAISCELNSRRQVDSVDIGTIKMHVYCSILKTGNTIINVY